MTDAQSLTEQVVPYLPLVGTVFGGLVVGGFAVWNRRRGAVEHRAPDVNSIWAREERGQKRLDTERAHRRSLEDVLELVLDAFRAYVRRVLAGGSTTLTDAEQTALDTEIPTPPKEDNS